MPQPCDCEHFVYEQGNPCFEPCGGGGGGLSDDQWYEQEIAAHPDTFDTGISKEQWIAWRSFWDDGTKRFRSENLDQDGNPIGGSGFEKPTDCPEGTTKHGDQQCLPPDHPAVQAAWNSGQPAAGGGGGGGSAAPAAPAAPKSLAQGQLQYTGNELMDTLANMFNYRAGIFGTGDPYQSGATPRTPKGKEIAGTFLPGGGLWWGEQTDLESALAPFAQSFAQPSATAALAPPKKPKKPKAPKTLGNVMGTVTPPPPSNSGGGGGGGNGGSPLETLLSGLFY